MSLHFLKQHGMILKSLLMSRVSLFIILILGLSSCSFFTRNSNSNQKISSLFPKNKIRFKLTDKAGEFLLYKEVGYKKSDKTYVSKQEVLPFNNDKTKILEQSITISKVGTVGKKLRIMRPEKSQYVVWFDGKKYISKMSLDRVNKSIKVKLISPEKQWNGTKSYQFPDRKSIYCFFSQVLECASITGFFKKSIREQKGQMNFYIIWDGFPYFQEQYLNVPKGLFTKAVLNLDGSNKKGENRFSLSFGGQVIFYMLNKSGRFTKLFWVSQGMTMVADEK